MFKVQTREGQEWLVDLLKLEIQGVGSMHCFSRGTEFSSQHPPQAAQDCLELQLQGM